MFGKTTIEFWQYLLIVFLFLGVGIGIGFGTWHDSNLSIASTYALDSCTIDTSHVGATGVCYPNAGDFPKFWQEATKNTTFTIDDKPVEITDVQVFYRIKDNSYWQEIHDSSTGTWTTKYFYTYGNITYYPSGIKYSQTYVAPTPTPTLCAWPVERTAYSFCGKVIVNSSAELDRLLKDIEKHSYHIQMGWMHLDYEYAHKTYDNTLPAPVNICMGIIPGDNFPVGSEWEGRMAYTVDDCATLGSCDFDTLILISMPTPTPM